ncbi:Uncharacterised protein (plasmid) [Legionella adelaidensis]|uniref:Uncharacterized protein n=1 Tax=Legionella adelaidensis TaxID=45056 RepID=A0A0W0R4I2_9GAMM|nr:hypothetical protein Lade_0621 [Legionella adelaidensis]VEH86287.1 Uncharacterised protein [Legionella adelaidensis]
MYYLTPVVVTGVDWRRQAQQKISLMNVGPIGANLQLRVFFTMRGYFRATFYLNSSKPPWAKSTNNKALRDARSTRLSITKYSLEL